MIGSYRDKRPRTFAEGGRVKAFQGFKHQAERRLEILDAAMSLSDLAALPGNRLEALYQRSLILTHFTALKGRLARRGLRRGVVHHKRAATQRDGL